MDEISKVFLHLVSDDGRDVEELESRVMNYLRQEKEKSYKDGENSIRRYLAMESREKAEYFDMLFHILDVAKNSEKDNKSVLENITSFLKREIGEVTYEESNDPVAVREKRKFYAVLYGEESTDGQS